MDEFARHADIFTPHDIEDRDLDIVGGGALGGAVLLTLTKMGFRVLNTITVTDFDQCTMHNLSNQWFRRTHVLLGQAKVDALAEMVAGIGERNLNTVKDRFTGSESRPVGPVVIVAVDSLEERARIWRNLAQRQDVDLLIDARMGVEVLEIHTVDLRRDDTAAYERSLEVPEGDAYEEPRGCRAIIYTVLGAAAFVGSILRAWCRDEPFPRHVLFDFRNYLMEVRQGPA